MSKAQRYADALKIAERGVPMPFKFVDDEGNNRAPIFVDRYGRLAFADHVGPMEPETALALAVWILDTFGGDLVGSQAKVSLDTERSESENASS